MLKPQFLLTRKQKLTILRPSTAGSYVKGRWVEGSPEEVHIEANIQPSGYRETVLLPEADRSKKSLKIYTASPVFGEEENERGADRFQYKGENYKIMKVYDFDMGVLNHFKAIAVMEEKVDGPV